jgi:alanyl-tRNA synthetase
VGIEAFRQFASERSVLSQLATTLKAPREDVPARVSDLVSNLKAAEKKLAAYEASALSARVPALVEAARTAGELRFVGVDVGAVSSSDDLRTLVTATRERLGSAPAVVALFAEVSAKPVVIVATNDAARGLGHRAGALARQAASILGGGGGGKDDLAQGGGTAVDKIDSALTSVAQTVLG